MSLTASNMLALGTALIDFKLPNVITSKPLYLTDYAHQKPVVIAFICNHCPYVKHLMDQLVRVGNDYTQKGIAFVAISSNDCKTHPDDSPENMKHVAEQKGFKFPYCYDEDQSVAKAYQAACTPDFYCFDQTHRLAYRGRFDSATPSNDLPVTGNELCDAMDAVLAGESVNPNQIASIGCNIKWKQNI